jgi:hypothetical protein
MRTFASFAKICIPPAKAFQKARGASAGQSTEQIRAYGVAGVPLLISGFWGGGGSGWGGICSPPVLTTISLKVKVNPHLIIFSRSHVMLS